MKSRSPKINSHPRWQRTALNTAVLMAVTAFCAPTVFAAQCDATIATAQTVPCEMNIPSATTITQAGSIDVTAATGTAPTASITIGAFANTVSINNSGTISNSAGGNAIFLASDPGTARTATIINQAGGTISADTASTLLSGAAIYYEGKFEGSLTNNGTIVASGKSKAAGIYVLGSVDGILNNTSSIDATTLDTSTLNNTRVYATGIYAESLKGGASITNSGTINATATTTVPTHISIAFGIDGGDLSSGASITNTSSISAQAMSNAGTLATGIDAGNLFDADLLNSNSITAVAAGVGSSTTTVEAFGMDVFFLDGGSSLTNSGTINVAVSGGGDMIAQGMNADTLSGMDSMLINSNIIQVTAIASSLNTASQASAYGIQATDLTDTAMVTNHGTITVTASAPTLVAGNVEAVGILSSSLVDADISNTGTIAVSASGAASVAAYGIKVNSLAVDSTLSNSGTVSATASGPGANIAMGIGGGDLSSAASITNTSSISAQATSNAGSSATGINAGLLFGADIVNSNSITAVASGLGNSAARVDAWGMSVSSLDGGSSLTNSGTIAVGVSGGGNMTAQGMKADTLSGMDSMLINNNIIQASATASSLSAASQAAAYGIQAVDLSDTAMVTNNGTILVTASAPSIVAGNVEAAGILSGNLVNADIANTGTIAVLGSGAANVAAYGIKVNSLDVNSTLTNSGTVSVTASGNNAYAVYATSGSGLVSNTGKIYGGVALGGTVNMVNSGWLSITNAAGNDSFVGGNFTQSGNGMLRVSVNDLTSYTKLVAGSASLGTNAQLSVYVPYSNGLTLGVVDNIITATLLNAPTGFTITDNSLAWQFTGVVEGNNIDLYATPTYLTSLANVAQGTGIVGLATVLDNIIISNPTSDAAQALYGVTSVGTAAEVMAVMQSYTPVLGGNATQSTLDILRTGATKVVYEHLQDAGGPYAGDSIPSEKAGWIKPYGSWAKQKDQPGSNGYQADSYGLVGGRDWQISNQWRMGGALSYSASKMATTNKAQRVDMKTYQAGVYARNYFNDVNVLNLQFDLGWNKNESQRAIAGSLASADYGSRHTMASAELERTFRTGTKTTFIPSVRGEYFNLKEKTYAEQGSPLNLTVMGQSQKAVILSLGGTVAYKLDDEATLTANLNLGRDLKARQAQTTASFSNSPGATFVTSGVTPSANIVRAGLGYEIEKASGTTIVTRYDLDKKSSGYVNHLLSLNYKTLF